MQALKKQWHALTERNKFLLIFFFVFSILSFVITRPSMVLMAALLFPWGLGMVYSRIRAKDFPRSAAFVLTCAMLVLYLLSVLTNMTVSSDWMCTFSAFIITSLYLLFVPRTLSKRDVRKELVGLAAVLVTAYMPFALIAMYSVFSGRVITLPGVDGVIGITVPGQVTDRIRIFGNTNTVARYGAFNMLFCIYALVVCRKAPAKVFFAFNLLLNTMILAHTQSRTCYIALAFGIGAILFRAMFLKLPARWWRIPAALAAGALGVGLSLSMLNWLYTIDVRLANMLADTGAPASYDVLTRAANEGQFDVYSSGRGDIWRPAIRYFFENPRYWLLGMGARNPALEIQQVYPEIKDFNMHNSYLASLLHCGIPYVLCMAGFLCTLIKPALVMLTAPSEPETRGQFIIPVFVGVMLLMALPENMLFVTSGYGNMLFHLFAGYLLHYHALTKG